MTRSWKTQEETKRNDREEDLLKKTTSVKVNPNNLWLKLDWAQKLQKHNRPNLDPESERLLEKQAKTCDKVSILTPSPMVALRVWEQSIQLSF